jgi:hypothetical protein
MSFRNSELYPAGLVPLEFRIYENGVVVHFSVLIASLFPLLRYDMLHLNSVITQVVVAAFLLFYKLLFPWNSMTVHS